MGKQFQAEACPVPILMKSRRKRGLLKEMADARAGKCQDGGRSDVPGAEHGGSEGRETGPRALWALAEQ